MTKTGVFPTFVIVETDPFSFRLHKIYMDHVRSEPFWVFKLYKPREMWLDGKYKKYKLFFFFPNQPWQHFKDISIHAKGDFN